MSGREWTPYELEVFMHHALSLDRFPRSFAPLYGNTRDSLIASGVLEWRDGIPKATDKGHHFLEMLLATPLPRNVWLDPRDGKQVLTEYQRQEPDPETPKEPTP